MEKNFLSLYKLDTRNKKINFHSSDWVNEISNIFEIIFVILTMQNILGEKKFKPLLFDRKWILSRF